MSGEPFVVDVVRSGRVESSHLMDVVVVDRAGALVASAGDPDVAAVFRSSAKPIQCRVALAAGWQPSGDRAIAIACASHNGEPVHVAEVHALLEHAGLAEGDLATPPDVPAYPPTHGVTERARIYHNCSGKHASMLAASAVNRWPLDNYRSPDHPLQRTNATLVASLLGVEPGVLVDGCGVPTFVAPLRAIARAFGAIDDDGPEAQAMRAHPFLVGGSERLDTDLMDVASHVLIKSGAEGLACVSAGEYAVAIKARDGDARGRARGPAVIEVLRALGVLDDDACAKLRAHAETPVLGGGEPVGAVHVRRPFDR